MSLATSDYLDFLPLYPNETEAACLARRRAWANEGLAPESDRWADTREGSHWYLASMPGVRAEARLYDLIGTEVPASAFVLWTWGTYLDDIGEALDVPRIAATYAQGEVTFTGPNGTVIPAGTGVSVQPVNETAAAPSFQTLVDATIALGVATVGVRAVEAGAVGNVAAAAITAIDVPIVVGGVVVTVTNAAPMSSGDDVEDDETYRVRVLEAFEGRGGGNAADYRRWARQTPGVGYVTVIPVWAGPDTVKVIISDPEGNPVAGSVIAALQARLDPIPGKAEGDAPVGHVVTIATAAAIPIDVTATVELDAGYALSDVNPLVRESVSAYIRSVEPGQEVVLSKVQARIAQVVGIHDLKLVRLNGGTLNIAVDDDPAQVPRLDDFTLTEGAVP